MIKIEENSKSRILYASDQFNVSFTVQIDVCFRGDITDEKLSEICNTAIGYLHDDFDFYHPHSSITEDTNFKTLVNILKIQEINAADAKTSGNRAADFLINTLLGFGLNVLGYKVSVN